MNSTDVPQLSTCSMKAQLLRSSYDLKTRNKIHFAKGLASPTLRVKRNTYTLMTWMDELERMDTAFSPCFPEMYLIGAYGMQVREAQTRDG